MQGFSIAGYRILLAQPVLLNGKREGTLYLLADLQAMSSQLLKLYGGIFALVLAASLLFAFLLSSRFQRFITNPILSLAGTARTVADDKDYSVRATKIYGDEVGALTDAFNQMLAQIQSQDSALAGRAARTAGTSRCPPARDRRTQTRRSSPCSTDRDPGSDARRRHQSPIRTGLRFISIMPGGKSLVLVREKTSAKLKTLRFASRMGARNHLAATVFRLHCRKDRGREKPPSLTPNGRRSTFRRS